MKSPKLLLVDDHRPMRNSVLAAALLSCGMAIARSASKPMIKWNEIPEFEKQLMEKAQAKRDRKYARRKPMGRK